MGPLVARFLCRKQWIRFDGTVYGARLATSPRKRRTGGYGSAAFRSSRSSLAQRGMAFHMSHR
jgi:hypothetical protein